MKGLVRSLARGNPQRASIQKLNIPFKDLVISVAGTTGVGWGTKVLRGLPQGNILFLGAVCNARFLTADADVTATYDGDFGIGTTPASDATITGQDVDIIASTALGAATAKLSPALRATNATQSIIDNTAGDLELNLNLLIDDATISGAADFTATGFLALAFVLLGDD